MVDRKKKTPIVDMGPYGFNDDIHIQYEIEWKKDIIKPGTLIKFKNDRGRYKFRCLAHNIKLDVTWVDCIDTKTLEWRSFYVDRLIGVIKPKRSRRHKAQQ